MRRSLHSLLLPTVLMASATVACDAKSPRADAAATPVLDSVVAAPPVVDSIAPAESSTVTPAPTAPKTATTTKTSDGTTKASTIIGRDSAFGPTFTVDPTGKVTPIDPTKKKP